MSQQNYVIITRNIFLDNQLYKSYAVDQHDPAKTEVIDVIGVNQLRIEIKKVDGRTFPVYFHTQISYN